MPVEQYEALLTALSALPIPFAEYEWATRPTSDFGVVALDVGYSKGASDNGTRYEVLEGSVDLFLHAKNAEKVASVETVLETVCKSSWELNSVQYEEDTRLLHYEWVFRV